MPIGEELLEQLGGIVAPGGSGQSEAAQHPPELLDRGMRQVRGDRPAQAQRLVDDESQTRVHRDHLGADCRRFGPRLGTPGQRTGLEQGQRSQDRGELGLPAAVTPVQQIRRGPDRWPWAERGQRLDQLDRRERKRGDRGEHRWRLGQSGGKVGKAPQRCTPVRIRPPVDDLGQLVDGSTGEPGAKAHALGHTIHSTRPDRPDGHRTGPPDHPSHPPGGGCWFGHGGVGSPDACSSSSRRRSSRPCIPMINSTNRAK